MNIRSIDTLVLGGGAIKGFALLGAIQYLQDNNLMTGIKKLVGTSIGAIIGYLLCIGYSPVELMVILCQNSFLDKLAQFDVINGVTGSGAAPFSIISDLIEKLTVQKIGRFLTLKDLYEVSGKTLVCCTYNYTKESVEYISHKNNPNLPCIVGLRMSANLPFLFEQFVYNGNVYIDGGIIDNVPFLQIEPEEYGLALKLVSPKGCNNFLDRVCELISIPVQHLESLRFESVKERCIMVEINIDISILKFNLSKTEKFDLFSLGYNVLRENINL